jgi:hypothetical protein
VRDQPHHGPEVPQGGRLPRRPDELLALAESNDAPEEVIEALEGLDDQTYDGPDEVVEALEL